MRNVFSFSVLLTICLGVLSCGSAHAVLLTPGLSRVRTTSQLGTPLVTVEDIDTQTGTTGPLSAGVVHSQNALAHDLDGLAIFSNPTAGTVNLSYIRSDSATFGTGIIFGGESLFRYQFNVDQPTTVVVDYDMLGTSDVTTIGFNGNQVNPWYAMQGFRVTVNGQSNYVNWALDAGFLPPWSNDPMPYAGTYLYNIPAGNSYLEISVAASSSGNQGQGTRIMEGAFDFQIGPVVPEPSLAGDFDNDGDVDGRDFLVWQRGGSPNGINSGDLALWQSHYGMPLTTNAFAVPEPSTWVFLLFAAVGGVLSRKR